MKGNEQRILIQYHLEKAQRALKDAGSLVEVGGSPEGR
jgi:hypothetical protein